MVQKPFGPVALSVVKAENQIKFGLDKDLFDSLF